MRELTIRRTLVEDSRGKDVRRTQEWLCLNGFGVVVDSHYGPASGLAVEKFQAKKQLPVTGEVDDETFASLVNPMQRAVDAELTKSSLGATVVAYAKKHLGAGPREVGGQNRGPWVRLYMKGNEGREWAWCAGFVCYVLGQACEALGRASPIRHSFSCDSLAASAKDEGRLLRERDASPDQLPPGTLFLNRRTSTDWNHVGIVLDARDRAFFSIEGNTNDSGDREGYEVCARTRGYRKKDYILLD